MKRIIAVLVLFLGVALAAPVQSQAKGKAAGLKKHALAKIMLAPVTVAKHSPHVMAVTVQMVGRGASYTLGSVFFVAESGVDVVHVATDTLDKGVAAEGWKKNVFHYPNVIVGYADNGLESLYQTFFGLKI